MASLKQLIFRLFVIILSLSNFVSAQIPLDIRSGEIKGIGGVIFGESELSDLREGFARNSATVQNFTYTGQFKPGLDLYEARQVSDDTSVRYIVTFRNRIVSNNIVVNITTRNDDITWGTFEIIHDERVRRLGYPDSESKGMYGWSFSELSYMLFIIQNDDGILQITEMLVQK